MRVQEFLATLETKSERKRVWTARNPGNYGRFLDLYGRVGYSPADPSDRQSWENRTLQAWSGLDESIPGTCGGGVNHEGKVVSGWGTLPISPSVVYGHSVCMDRTLWGVSTLYLLGLYSIEWATRIPGIAFWAGSYSYRSGFTGRLQRPNFDITDQLVVDVLKILPDLSGQDTYSTRYMLDELSETDLLSISGRDRKLFGLLRHTHPMLNNLHTGATHTVRTEQGDVIAVHLEHVAAPELTAANVLSRIWVFPNSDVTEFSDEIVAIARRISALNGKVVHLVAPPSWSIPSIRESDRLVPSFWAFCPKQSLHLLRASLVAAFEPTIEKYGRPELEAFIALLGS